LEASFIDEQKYLLNTHLLFAKLNSHFAAVVAAAIRFYFITEFNLL
jgi:hypothetical protein